MISHPTLFISSFVSFGFGNALLPKPEESGCKISGLARRSGSSVRCDLCNRRQQPESSVPEGHTPGPNPRNAGPSAHSPAPALCDVGQCLPRVATWRLGQPRARVTRRSQRAVLQGENMHFLFTLVIFFYLWSFLTAQGQKKEESAEEVKIEVLHRPENCSKTSKKGDLLNAHYDGYLAKDGSKFYCSRTQNEGHPKWFVLGVGQVIKGLDIAMMNMCPGEKRKVIIPPSFAYGKEGYEGKIPPDATLIFEIELYAVTKGPRSVETFKQIDTDNDRQLSKTEISLYLKREFEKDEKPRDKSYQEAVLEDIFKKNDHDGDGFISPKEYNVYQHDEL
ncbi:peptidyl-prolyl cis-trans isomerase FKBP7 isoform X2 [Lemur catta]|uniref:peptidyl-prolyl cis-trans isomerase FKBP7 isoform X2 n=1 Tax=Lemur catta TaxID=9447 RepID=UPI001E266647|nr:peptidyl-prolyl cis-trans isomerase FKBP7 isoform X2 [Lemur catta]